MNQKGENSSNNNLIESIEKISNRVLAFQYYSMKKVWGVLFGAISILIITGSILEPILIYFLKYSNIAEIVSALLFAVVFISILSYWFRLFDRSMRIVHLRSSFNPEHSYSNFPPRRELIRASVVCVFLVYYVLEITLALFEHRLLLIVSPIITFGVFTYLGAIMLRGLQLTFNRIPAEGYAVFSSLLLAVSSSSILQFIKVPSYFEIISVEIIIAISTIISLISSFSFIYHAPDFLEGIHE